LRLRGAAGDDGAGFTVANLVAHRAPPVHRRGEVFQLEPAAGPVPTSGLTDPVLS
jgi:hypothetical protein